MTRFHDLDALRAFAMLLGMVLHASLFLVPVELWPASLPYTDETDTSRNPYAYIVAGIHGFRMPVFFALSGFFTAMMWQARGLRGLGEHRVKRIALPLLISMFTVIPVIYWLAAGPDFRPLDWVSAWWLEGFYHLWFLWFLLLMAGGFIALARLGVEFRSHLWWLLIPLALIPQYFMREGMGADTPSGVIPRAEIFGYYSLFFGVGVFFYQRGFAVRRGWAAMAGAAALLFLPTLAFSFPQEFPELDENAAWVLAAGAGLKVTYAWLMVFGLMGLFRWTMARERYWVRYMSDASYWLYICHVPLVIAGQQLAERDGGVNPHLAFLLILGGVTAILLVSYRWGVRYTPIGTMLNGKRARRAAAAGAG